MTHRDDRDREIAEQVITLLSIYWTADDPAELREAQATIWLDVLRDFDPAIVRSACCEWSSLQTRRPTPADIRKLCAETVNHRRQMQAIEDRRKERWPKWLEEIWGAEPEGPRRRAEALAKGHAAEARDTGRILGDNPSSEGFAAPPKGKA